MWVKGVNVVEENCLVSSRGPSRQPSVCNPLTAVCERTGLGSSLGAGEGNTGVVVLEVMLGRGVSIQASLGNRPQRTSARMLLAVQRTLKRLYEELGALEYLPPSMTSVWPLQRVYLR